MIDPFVAFFVALVGLTIFFMASGKWAPRKPSPTKEEIYACGERGVPHEGQSVELSYAEYLAFFALIEIAPLLLALAAFSGVLSPAILFVYAVLAAVASVIVSWR
ncbi:MAG TPA: hypothetical protein ENG69_05305 [Candidatus Korarchaeota archaeon]|nr:hypothetical protein [Candidatus Korarchaeota archaeon]